MIFDVMGKLWNHKNVRVYHQIFGGILHLLASVDHPMPTDLLVVLFTPKMGIPLHLVTLQALCF